MNRWKVLVAMAKRDAVRSYVISVVFVATTLLAAVEILSENDAATAGIWIPLTLSLFIALIFGRRIGALARAVSAIVLFVASAAAVARVQGPPVTLNTSADIPSNDLINVLIAVRLGTIADTLNVLLAVESAGLALLLLSRSQRPLLIPTQRDSAER